MSMNLYVGNLYRGTTEEALKNYFETCGVVNSVRIIMDRETGQSRGFAFVTMASVQDGQAVIAQLDGKELDGRPLRISEAQERAPRPAGGERRSFGSGERRGGFGGGNNDRGGFGGGRRRSF